MGGYYWVGRVNRPVLVTEGVWDGTTDALSKQGNLKSVLDIVLSCKEVQLQKEAIKGNKHNHKHMASKPGSGSTALESHLRSHCENNTRFAHLLEMHFTKATVFINAKQLFEAGCIASSKVGCAVGEGIRCRVDPT